MRNTTPNPIRRKTPACPVRGHRLRRPLGRAQRRRLGDGGIGLPRTAGYGCPLPIPAAHPGQRPGPRRHPLGGPGHARCGACEEGMTLGNMGVACVIPTFVGVGVW
jgi:hypothetical protein